VLADVRARFEVELTHSAPLEIALTRPCGPGTAAVFSSP
jgi:hypothetical protein